MAASNQSPPPVVLIVRDGWGQNPHPEHRPFNAVELAKTPIDDRLRRQWPWTLIKSSGEDVGLPDCTMGNSEVGHQNIGAGRIVDQEITRISRAIHEGTFFENPALIGAFEHARRTGGRVHIMGLVSNGLVHSDIEHVLALIDMSSRSEFPAERLFIHAFTDGRDTGPTTGLSFIDRVQKWLDCKSAGRIASVIGRYYSMDRDHRWQRIALAYHCLTGRGASFQQINGETTQQSTAFTATEAIERYYEQPSEPSRTGDEFITPTQIVNAQGEPIGLILDGDAVIFFNYRGDRPRELTGAFMHDDETWANMTNDGFDRGARLEDLYFCSMSEYEKGLPVSAIAFSKSPRMTDILGDVVSQSGLRQFRCAETEKFPHITFFFNDYRETPFEGENRLLVPSPRDVTTYDQRPEMSAELVCEGVLERLRADDCESFILVNFANPDMVGHTGMLEPVIRAVQTVDACVGRIIDTLLVRGGSAIVTADHGNAEQMWNLDQKCPHTAHTLYDVPLFALGERFRNSGLREDGRLADIAPTVLAMMGLDPPAAMTGKSLLSADVIATHSG